MLVRHRFLTAAAAGVLAIAAAFCPMLLVAAEQTKPADKNAKVTYDDHVKPIFREKCAACHNTDKKTGGLDLTTYSGSMAGGGSGAVIDPGNAGDSYLFTLVSHAAEPHMPPKSDKLPADVLATISKWIQGGALENGGSKPIASKKPKVDLSLKSAPTGRPEGPPPMPERLSLEPVVRAARSTAPRTVATSPWAPLAAVAGQEQVLLFNTQSLALVGVLPFPEGEPYALKFSQNGMLLLAGGGRGAASGRVVVWNVKSGERVFEIGDELDAVLGADISADQSLIALGGPNKIVRVFSTADGTLKYEMKKHTDWVYSVAFSPDGVLLATADRNGGVVVWEAQTGREYLVLGGHATGVTGLSWRIDSNILASCSEDTTIKLWEMENGGLVKNWGAHPGGTTSVDFTRDGRLVSCGRDRIARLWDQNGAEQKAFSGFADIVLCVAYCDESSRLVAGDWTGALSAWNPADGKSVGTLNSNPPMLAERLDEATKRFAAQQSDHKKRSDLLAAAQTEAQKHQSELGAGQKALVAAEAELKTATEAAVKAKATVGTLTAELAAAATIVAALDPVVPTLKEAAEKGVQAASKVAGDKELAAAAEQLNLQYTKKNAQLNEAKKTAADRTARLEKANPELAAAEKRVAGQNAATVAAKKRVADLAPIVKAADENAAKAKQAADSAAQTFAQAQHDVQRWQNEIVFRDKTVALAAVQSKFVALSDAVQVAQAAVDAQKAAVDKQEQGRAAAQKEAESAAAAVKKAQELVAQLTVEQTAAMAKAGTLGGLIPALKETLAKAEESAAKSGGDADVAAEVTQIKSLVGKKAAELDATNKAVAEKTAGVAAAKAAVPVAEKKRADFQAAVEAANKAVAAAAAAVKPLDEKRAAAKAVMDEGSKSLEAAKKEVNAMKTARSA